MSKYKELIYIVLDELKLVSDDSIFNEEHVLFLLNKYRSFLLKQRYSDIKKIIPESNYLSLCLNLIQTSAISGDSCEEGYYLKTSSKIPTTLTIGQPKVTTLDYYQGEITYISRERMRYVGHNKFLPNIIYCSISPDLYLYFKSYNPLFAYLEKVRFTAIFEDADKVINLLCNNTDDSGNIICDIMDMDFPIEEALITPLIELVVKELAGPSWKPKDDSNNANDDLASMANFITRNMKSGMQKQIEE